MLSKADIKKLAKKIVRHQSGRRTHQIMHPGRDWLIGVGFGVVIVVVSATWSGSSYLETKETITAGVSAEAEDAVVYRESNVETALQLANERMQNVDAVVPVAEPAPEETATSTATSSEPTPLEDLLNETEFEMTATSGRSEPVPEPLNVPVTFE